MIPNDGVEKCKQQLALLRSGNERGLSFFYRKYYARLYLRSCRASKSDSCAAMSIVQEAFLRLWMCRTQMNTELQLQDFLKAQVKSAIQAYYRQSQTMFQRNLLQIDGIDNYQDFLLPATFAVEAEDDIVIEASAKQRIRQWRELEKMLPTISQQQQLLVRLCLKYNFNYDRIAYHLGGISDYEVGLKVEKTLNELREIFSSKQKLTLMHQPIVPLRYEGKFSTPQQEIFRLRYTLQYSFEQIAQALQLSEAAVKTLFINAHANTTPKNNNKPWKKRHT